MDLDALGVGLSVVGVDLGEVAEHLALDLDALGVDLGQIWQL